MSREIKVEERREENDTINNLLDFKVDVPNGHVLVQNVPQNITLPSGDLFDAIVYIVSPVIQPGFSVCIHLLLLFFLFFIIHFEFFF
jgi:hypothetical protein